MFWFVLNAFCLYSWKAISRAQLELTVKPFIQCRQRPVSALWNFSTQFRCSSFLLCCFCL